jgi:hypothetical protein
VNGSESISVKFSEGKFAERHPIEIDYLNPQEYASFEILEHKTGGEIRLIFRQPGVVLRKKRDFTILIEAMTEGAAVSGAISATAAGGLAATLPNLLTVIRALLR